MLAVILWSIAEAEQRLQHGLRVNSLSPGGIATGILGDFQLVFGAAMARNIERAGRAGQPEEVAEFAAFLLSPASNWIKGKGKGKGKGCDIAIDGGMGAFNMADAMDLGVLNIRSQESAA